MPEALPTSILSAILWATIGASFVRLRWRATYDQLVLLWLMTTFGFSLAGAPLVGVWGWQFGLGFSSIAAFAPAVAYHYHLGGTSPDRSERWSVALYAGLLLATAAAVTLSAATFVKDFRLVSGLSPTVTSAVLLGTLLVVGIAGVLSALELRTVGR